MAHSAKLASELFDMKFLFHPCESLVLFQLTESVSKLPPAFFGVMLSCRSCLTSPSASSGFYLSEFGHAHLNRICIEVR